MPQVKLTTTMGDIVIALDAEKAPISTENILSYVRDGHYDGTVFHRVIDGFMIQGGGYDQDLERRPTKDPIKNEATNGLKNVRGSVAMARTSDIESATAQFFVNVVDNPFLDHQSDEPDKYGYAVIGNVAEGMDIVDKIKGVPTGAQGKFSQDCPEEAIVIQSATIVDEG